MKERMHEGSALGVQGSAYQVGLSRGAAHEGLTRELSQTVAGRSAFVFGWLRIESMTHKHNQTRPTWS